MLTTRAWETFERRYGVRGGSERAPVMNAAYIAAYLVDPYFAVWSERFQTYTASEVDLDLFEEAAELVRRVGGDAAESQLRSLRTEEYPKAAKGWVKQLVDARLAVEAQRADNAVSGKRSRLVQVPSARKRYTTWDQFAGMPELNKITQVALRLLSTHSTSAATERNWSLWGRIFVAARSSLGLERAKKMIAICAAEQAEHHESDDFALTLDILECTEAVLEVQDDE